MGSFNKIADLAQKASVLGLVSLLGFQVYQIGVNVADKRNETRNEHAEFMEKINEKVEEESRYKNSIDKIPDRYDPDDDSYRKNLPKFSSKS
mmetsp:Transcript_120642/g.348603  ORF Transcript_120642/g.348603 Transcript_120642/m.348603 type:complete len:92 (+) Transcript_120642:96-371(+)